MRKTVVVALGIALICAVAAPARAGWMLTSPGSGYGKAMALPGGPTPAVSVTGRNVTVSWSAVSLPDGAAVTGYRVRRYHASTGLEAAVTSNCDVVATALTCTERGVTSGNWRYGVSAMLGNWTGAEGDRSPSVTVASPAMSFSSSTTLTSLPTTLTGNLTGFVSGASITFRLDNPTSGTLLTGSTNPATIPDSGAATFSVTIPAGTANGSHTVYALGAQGDVASASVDVRVDPPRPTNLVTINAGGSTGAGRPAQGDVVEITYSERLAVSSLCSTWSGDTTNQSINADWAAGVTFSNNAAPSGNDQLTLPVASSVCGGTFNFGAIDLGSNAYVTSNTTFAGSGTARTTVTWNATNRVLSIRLGGLFSGSAPARLTNSLTATYTPSAAIRNPNGVAITGTASSTAVQF